MSKNKMIIGSHSHTHPVLSNIDLKSQKNEIFFSSKILNNIIGKKIEFFSYPYGIKKTYNKSTFELLKKAGIKYSFIADNHRDGKRNNNLKIRRYDCNKFLYGKAK